MIAHSENPRNIVVEHFTRDPQQASITVIDLDRKEVLQYNPQDKDPLPGFYANTLLVVEGIFGKGIFDAAKKRRRINLPKKDKRVETLVPQDDIQTYVEDMNLRYRAYVQERERQNGQDFGE